MLAIISYKTPMIVAVAVLLLAVCTTVQLLFVPAPRVLPVTVYPLGRPPCKIAVAAS